MATLITVGGAQGIWKGHAQATALVSMRFQSGVCLLYPFPIRPLL